MAASYDPFTYANGFIPELTASNIVNLSTKTNRFVKSGILTPDDTIGQLSLTTPGEFITMPFTNDLEGDPETWDDTKDISVSGLSTGKQRMFKLRQAKAFGYTDIAQEFTVSNPRDVIQTRFSNFWTNSDQKTTLKTASGVLSNSDIGDSKIYVEPTAHFTPRGFLATLNLFGDLQDSSLNKIVVNSAVYAEMKANNMLDNPANSAPQNQSVLPFGTYNGMTIVVDDDLPLDADGTATSYMFADGAMCYSVASPENAVEVERESRASGGRTNIINRRVLTCHVKGTTVADNYTPTGQTTTIDDLAKGTTWDSVVDPRNIRLVAYKAKVSDDFNPNKKSTAKPTQSK